MTCISCGDGQTVMFNEITKINLLYDFYGELLTDKQKEVMQLYHEENLSLSEIGEEFHISRQGVHDTLKNAEKALNEYESKLGLVAKFDVVEKTIEKVDTSIVEMIANDNLDESIEKKLLNIKASVDSIND